MTDDLPDDWFRPRHLDEGGPAEAGRETSGPETTGPAESDQAESDQTTSQRPGSWLADTWTTEPETPVNPVPAVVAVSRRHWLGRHPMLSTAIVMIVALSVGLSLGQWWRTRDVSGVDPQPSGPSSAADSSSVAKPYDGPTKPIKPTAVTASCTADPAKDASGAEVTYGADFVLDSNPATAWRCDSDGLGQQLTFTFAPGTTVVGVGIINGYTKVSGDEQLYSQYRRVTSVEWRLAAGSSFFTQSLADNNLTLQQVSIPPVATGDSVTMTIVQSTEPGRADDATRNAVLISQVQFFTQA